MTHLFERNENGQGFRPTARGMMLLHVWDVLSWIVAAIFFGTLLTQGAAPWWLFVLVAPFAVGPFLLAMFFSGKGPIGALTHYSRAMGERS